MIRKYETNEKWNKDNTKVYRFRFMFKRDAAIIEHLDSVENKTDYIRRLILRDINKTND